MSASTPLAKAKLMGLILGPAPEPDPNDPPCSKCGHAKSCHNVDPKFLWKHFRTTITGCTAREADEIGEVEDLIDTDTLRVATFFFPHLSQYHDVQICNCKEFIS